MSKKEDIWFAINLDTFANKVLNDCRKVAGYYASTTEEQRVLIASFIIGMVDAVYKNNGRPLPLLTDIAYPVCSSWYMGGNLHLVFYTNGGVGTRYSPPPNTLIVGHRIVHGIISNLYTGEFRSIISNGVKESADWNKDKRAEITQHVWSISQTTLHTIWNNMTQAGIGLET